MSYSYTIHDSIERVNRCARKHVCAEGGGQLFTSPELLAAVEASMGEASRFWHVILYDRDNVPVACASFSTFRLDIADTIEPALKGWVVALRHVLPRLTYLQLLIGGLPLSAGQNNIVMAPGSDRRRAMDTIDEIARRLAAEERVQMIVYKEFGAGDLEWSDELAQRGYRRAQTPPMFHFNPQFLNLAEYIDALTAHYRYLIRRSTRKLVNDGIRISFLTEPDAILDIYTPQVHDLYVAVARKSEIRLELHGVTFFRELVRRLSGSVSLVVLSKESRILALMWGLTHQPVSHSLSCGVDYGLNERYDLYFNLEYATIDFAMRQRVLDIQLGQTA